MTRGDRWARLRSEEARNAARPGALGSSRRPRTRREGARRARPLGTRSGRSRGSGGRRQPSSPHLPGDPSRAPERSGALWPGANQACRAAGRHGAQARRAGASPVRLSRRGPGALGLLAERGPGRGAARWAPRSRCGCRAAGGGQWGADGRPHPEAVLPGPGEAAHQLHAAGPGEVMRRQARPGAPARPSAPGAALAPAPSLADCGADSARPVPGLGRVLACVPGLVALVP